jgi:hypothetical protein
MSLHASRQTVNAANVSGLSEPSAVAFKAAYDRDYRAANAERLSQPPSTVVTRGSRCPTPFPLRRGVAASAPGADVCTATMICVTHAVPSWSCRRVLADSEPIHRVSLSWFHHHTVIRLVCRLCAVRIVGANREWREPIACEGCGRPVIHDRNRQPPQHVICGEECRCAVRAARVRSRREPMRDLSERRCAKCGSPFTAMRDNARYCSSPCRQKAYRQRRHQAAA